MSLCVGLDTSVFGAGVIDVALFSIFFHVALKKAECHVLKGEQ
jgi:hypothetical protein